MLLEWPFRDENNKKSEFASIDFFFFFFVVVFVFVIRKIKLLDAFERSPTNRQKERDSLCYNNPGHLR